MTRVRVVSLRSFDPVIDDLSPRAFRAWQRARDFCDFHGTDGVLSPNNVKTVGASPAQQKELLEAGLWEIDELGQTIVCELRYGPSVANVDGSEVEHRRALTAERTRRWRAKKGSTSPRDDEERHGDASPSVTESASPSVTVTDNGMTPSPSNSPSLSLSVGSLGIPESYSSPTCSPKDLKESARVSGERANIVRVFEFWRAERKKRKTTKLDKKREARIRSLLRHGFTPEQLCQAIQNAKYDKFLMGENDAGKVYDCLTSLLRDPEKVERLLELKPNGGHRSEPTSIARALEAKERPPVPRHELVPAKDIQALLSRFGKAMP